MTIAEYVEYEKKMNGNHISNTKSYLPTYFSKSAPTHDPIREFAHYFGPNQPSTESDCDSEDMEDEVEYMTDDEVVMSDQEESNHGYTQNIQHFKEKDDVDKWLNAEITKHMSIQGQIEASKASIGNETSPIASNEVDTNDDNTSTTTPCLLPKELSPGSFLLPFNINNHSLYAITTLDAKDNIIPLNVYEYLGLDEFRGAGPPGYYTKIDNRCHPVWLDRQQRDPESDATEVLQHQLPRKELNPGNFTLPCTIDKFNFYAMADLGASINVMPRSIFEHLHLTNLRKTNMLCEMADMSKKASLRIVENVLVKIGKFLFLSDFVIIDNTPSETTILGRPFLATIRAEIDVFAGKISLGINEDRISFDSYTYVYES
ncbi:phospholipase-like protein [Tanacetum coccineum]|uniref:Phospholipase-like protein n=1 Tax=Tanacetum coccineum TaxID=301880 RepID=A0ABQ5DV62_9ASTR